MKRTLVGIIGLILLGATAEPTAAQLRVVVGVNTPPVSARVVIGDPGYLVAERVYLYPYHPYGIWVTDRHLARLHRRHVAWIEYEHARIARLRYYDHRYWQTVRAFERERLKRERAIEREYRKRLRELDRDARGWDRDWDRARGNGNRGRGRR